MKLRPYQQQAHDALWEYFRANTGNPLVELPTGSGKSLVIAQFIKSAMATKSDLNVIVLAHVKELLQQNMTKSKPSGPTHPSVYTAQASTAASDSISTAASCSPASNQSGTRPPTWGMWTSSWLTRPT